MLFIVESYLYECNVRFIKGLDQVSRRVEAERQMNFLLSILAPIVSNKS